MDSYMMLGFTLSVCIGISLGLVGGGGSMLTLPVLVYLFRISPVQSSSYSLFVVGITSLVGATQYLRRGQVDYKAGFAFVIPSMLAVYLSRAFLSELVSGPLIMLLFAGLMVVSGYSMIRENRFSLPASETNLVRMGCWGVVIGLLTGLVGAGGGCLIIPALVMLARLPMHTAVGTSLFIITIKSLFGFAGDYAQLDINWFFLLPFTLLSVVGIEVGRRISPLVSAALLKRAFGWLMILIASGIFYRELIMN